MTPLPLTSLPGLGASGALTPATAPTAAPTAGGVSFQSFLSDKLGSVADLQSQADAASQAIATGRSDDLSGATIAVEKASIATELTGAIRNKAIDAYQEIMRMQV